MTAIHRPTRYLGPGPDAVDYAQAMRRIKQMLTKFREDMRRDGYEDVDQYIRYLIGW